MNRSSVSESGVIRFKRASGAKLNGMNLGALGDTSADLSPTVISILTSYGYSSSDIETMVESTDAATVTAIAASIASTGSTYQTDSGATSTNTWLDTLQSITSSIGQVYTTYLTAQGQANIAQLNQALIAAGKPPLTSAQIASLTPGVNFGLSPQTQQLVMYGGIAALGIYLFSSMRRGRR